MSSSTVAQAIVSATQKYTISVYFVVLIGGVIGNLFNIVIFSGLKIFRRNQCAFYLIFGSIADFLLLIIVLPFRITQFAFGYDPTLLSLAWCKIRFGVVSMLSLLSFTAVCFTAIDQYLSTHYLPQVRQLSSLKMARRLVCIALITWSLHSIPICIFFEIQPTLGCDVYNLGFSRYFSFVHFCVLSGILPITTSGCSAMLAYLNVRRIIRRQVPLVQRKLDRQLTTMILTRVAFLLFMTSPFVIFRIYQLNQPATSSTDRVKVAVEKLVLSITTSLFYTNSGGTFYVFLLVSNRFRQQVKRAVTKNIWKKISDFVRHGNTIQNQVAPASDGIDIDLEPQSH
ncbi:unnamed protein product [Rotaria socialis]|uniref:G-protein coupled receptors family 1 profile domain-containing protein n=1 Tax=Rotaria socialis TaxID=392032 RepID=A0A820SWC0_9BILA|nr:unnamed protein product [Rotaria socialis]CAF3394307.1 unnamed protein product [Rotaria socialis]CAF3641510.1 unnamed protein product [Rotaria socialis]CAF4460987.1 unnamed protein product [Rotaria socialis]CAF4474337.1 unnamed protein product [Rotaria socialis]